MGSLEDFPRASHHGDYDTEAMSFFEKSHHFLKSSRTGILRNKGHVTFCVSFIA